jgi:hypothetical protein
MKALSIKQPWAGLIIAGIKTVENRTWSTRYSGPLAICSTQKPDPEAIREMTSKLGTLPASCLINGAILGTVTLSALVWLGEDGTPETDHAAPNEAQILEWWNTDGYGWILETPKPLKRPVPLKGRLGLFNIPDNLLS